LKLSSVSTSKYTVDDTSAGNLPVKNALPLSDTEITNSVMFAPVSDILHVLGKTCLDAGAPVNAHEPIDPLLSEIAKNDLLLENLLVFILLLGKIAHSATVTSALLLEALDCP